MLVESEKYNWSKWTQPLFTGSDTWGTVEATSVHVDGEKRFEPFYALDGNRDTHWEGADWENPVDFIWLFDMPLKIYRIELVNKPSNQGFVTHTVEIFADNEMTEPLLAGEFLQESKSTLALEPALPFSSDRLVFHMTTENRYIGLSSIRLIAEFGKEKTILRPFLDTAENMDVISGSYNDDSTFQTAGLNGFWFNGKAVSTLYISSNHWLGFGVSSEQLKILRRDGCSTSIYSQFGETSNGLTFLKIRFEGYTVYNNRVEENRLIFELFLLSNNDMFLNVIRTPTTGNTGTSQLICNGTTTALSLCDGSGGGMQVSFYHLDMEGRTWNIQYAMYEETGDVSFSYLMRQGDDYFTVVENALQKVPVERLTAAMFLHYGFEELPTPELLTPMSNPQLYLWKAGGPETLLKAVVKAYPYPQVLTSVINMSHISILGISLMTAEYSGDVGVSFSLDEGETFSGEMALSDWLNTDPEELYNSLPENRILILRFTLHDNAALSRFKITYKN